MIRKFCKAFHVPGTLTANLNIRWIPPDNCQLLHVSGVTSNDAATTVDVGDAADAGLHVEDFDVGAGANTIHELADVQDFTEFETGQWPRIADGDTVVIAVDYDGDSGTAGHDLTLVLTFAEG